MLQLVSVSVRVPVRVCAQDVRRSICSVFNIPSPFECCIIMAFECALVACFLLSYSSRCCQVVAVTKVVGGSGRRMKALRGNVCAAKDTRVENGNGVNGREGEGKRG